MTAYTPLRPYQVAGAKFLAGKKAALLADDMGLGKTAQAVAACDEVGAESVLVICPASVCETWRREFKRFSMSGIIPTVLSYDKAARGYAGDYIRNDVLILDEAHYLKSATSKRTQAVFGFDAKDGKLYNDGLVAQAKHVFLLTGTPMPNNPSELWPALRAVASRTILNPKSGAPYSYWQFVSKFCKTKDSGFGLQIVGAKNHADLKARLEPFMLRRLKSEVLAELPPLQFEPLYVEGPVARGGQGLAEEFAAIRILREEGIEGLAKHPLPTLRRLTGQAKVSACIEWIKDFLTSGKQLVVFAYHHEVIAVLSAAFPGSAVVTGGTIPARRFSAVDDFQNGDAKLFIGQIQAAGTGITLTAASDVLFVESDWVPANVHQAAARIHRHGQTESCMVRFATLAGSVDEDISRALARKMYDIEKIVG